MLDLRPWLRVAWIPPLCLLLSCGEPQTLSETALTTTFQDLHKRIYGVYDLGSDLAATGRDPIDRDAVHRHLSKSFAGEALTREYLEHFTSLTRMADEATSIRVLRVDYESIRVLGSSENAVTIDVDWSVGGIVTHRRHRHPRTNRYRAIYELANGAQGWRLVSSRMRDMSRVKGFSTFAGGETWPLDNLPKGGGGLMSPLDLLKAGMDEDVEEYRRNRQSENQAEEGAKTPP